jgi:RNA polymerase sigma-70 factor (ECF subfamily)
MIPFEGGLVATGDATLIEGSLTEAASFALIFDRHYPRIHRFLRGRVGADLADDLASEVFSVAFRRRGTYDLSRADSRPWLYGIAINVLRRHRRWEARRLSAMMRAADPQITSEGSLVEHLDPALAAALAGLSFEERNLILLFAWAELSYEQLADALALPVGTVRSRLHRTRAKLRATLVADAELDVIGRTGECHR